ncbi:MAG: FG-GAP-like repeat-containing protein [Pseudomonadota bacterium]|nr:FG-GAP-like repeat-containing protein [Pseudomonadota bacterium]
MRRSGAYTFHAVDLSEEHALRSMATGDLSFAAPDGTQIRLAYERHVEHPDGNWSWIGRAATDQGESTVITFGEDAVFGTIPQGGDKPDLRLTVADGRTWVVSADPRLLREIRNEATHPTRPDFLIPGDLATAVGASAEEMEIAGTSAASETITAATTVDGNTIVDVLVGFTDGYSSFRGGDSAAITRVHNLVDITNQAFANSQATVRARLVHSMKIVYPDATANKTALEEMTGFKAPSTRTTPAPAFAGMRSARDQFGADLVVLLRRFQEPENGSCGVAWLIGGGLSGIDSTDQFFGYSVVSDGQDSGTDGRTFFCREETFAHELGHNMGSQHDSENAKKDDGSVSFGAFRYSFGLKTGTGAGNFITVMASGDSGVARYRVFSNPNVSICGGFACGVADQADNARSLRATAPTIASFRPTVVPLEPVAGVRARHDISGDGRADLLLYRPSDGRLLPWLSNGAPGFLPEPSILVGGEFRVIATGDFNGDGKMDLIWSRPAGDMQYWHGDGQGFAQRQFFTTFPAGWTLVGTGDVDGDGKKDLVWHRARDGLLAYWIMNGPQITRHGAVSVGGTWRVIAVDDFNGDGKADLLWNRTQGDMQYWEGDGASFGKRQFFTTYPEGWTLLATGDVDGDAKADLLWHRAKDSLLAYWVMSGPVITRHGAASGLSFSQSFAGDFNADGKLDLLVQPTSSSSSYVHWTGDGAGFANRVVLNGYPAGYEIIPWKD